MIYSGFRLLTEYHSFLSFSLYNLTFRLYLLLPSPYGVSFILIFKDAQWGWKKDYSFRLLTEYHSFLSEWLIFGKYIYIDGFRLLTEYHSFLLEAYSLKEKMKATTKVSVSLRSIIHSYKYNEIKELKNKVLGFRLLTEYHSFL